MFLEAFAIAINSMHWEHSAELLVLCHAVWGLSENDVCLATADRYQWVGLVWEDKLQRKQKCLLHVVLRHDIVAFGVAVPPYLSRWRTGCVMKTRGACVGA